MNDGILVQFIVPLWMLKSIAAALVTAILFVCWEGFNAPPIPKKDK